ncbi:hypothetical protein HYX14_04600 [Candidatus Woesearchaeota archaeon]|nr:hypothetical protein [Candidatus Woesearchaeota archaeon]
MVNENELQYQEDEVPAPPGYSDAQFPATDYPKAMPQAPPEDIYSRMEDIAETLIDERWEELIDEVKKVVVWKEKVEDRLQLLETSVNKLKEDFTLLHHGVLGKLEEYDTRMQDVGTELKAVGKVFKDVVPVFTQNVKDLASLVSETKGVLKKK